MWGEFFATFLKPFLSCFLVKHVKRPPPLRTQAVLLDTICFIGRCIITHSCYDMVVRTYEYDDDSLNVSISCYTSSHGRKCEYVIQWPQRHYFLVPSREDSEKLGLSESELSNVPLVLGNHIQDVVGGQSCIDIDTSCNLSTNILDETTDSRGTVECVLCLEHPAVYCVRGCGHLLFCEPCVTHGNNIFCSGDVGGFCIVCRRKYPEDGDALIKLDDAVRNGIRVFVV